IAWAVLKEPLSLYSLVGVILVIAGLYIAQQFKISAQKE
ncbi:MAG: EamA family transporter, partial [Bacteroidetes bacterium]|nr:EamA family transporter [Bacteroidota bacterium]